jgi:ribosomal silencing factor RsfS
MQNSKIATQSMQERRKNSMKNRIANALKRTGNMLAGKSGDQMTGWLIVVLVVVVVGAVFLTLYQGSISDIWNNIVTKITSLLS